MDWIVPVAFLLAAMALLGLINLRKYLEYRNPGEDDKRPKPPSGKK